MSGDRAKRPAFQWYPGDHRRDTAVQACSFGARALWREMLDLMHDGEPYGHLTAGGVAIDETQLARLVGVSSAKARRWVAELEARKVFSRTEVGVIYSRRMVRDEQKRNTRGAGGGKSLENPNVPRPKDGQEEPPKDPEKDRAKDTLDPSFGGSPAVAVAFALAGEDQEQPPAPRSASRLGSAANGGQSRAAKPPPNYPHFAKADCDELYHAWTVNIGAVDYGRFRKAFARLFTSDTPPYSVNDLCEAIAAAYDDANTRFEHGDDFAVRNLKPETFVDSVTHWVKWAKMPAERDGVPTAKGARALA
jgi:hypothetical protein